jgi:Lon protease-like protein
VQKTTQIFFEKMPRFLPIMDAEEALLLPSGRLKIIVRDPICINMIEDVLTTRERLLGMVILRQGEKNLYEIGCAGRIVYFEEMDDGCYAVSLLGISRFRISKKAKRMRGYQRIEADWEEFRDDFNGEQEIIDFSKKRLLELLRLYLKNVSAEVDWETIIAAPSLSVVNFFSMNLDFENRDRQALLECKTSLLRAQILESLLEIAVVAKNHKPREH